MDMLENGIMPDAAALEKAGLTSSQAAAYIAANQKTTTSGGSNKGGNNTGTGTGKWDDVVAWVDKYGEDAAEDYIAEHYKALGYSTKSQALAGWKNYLTENSGNEPTGQSTLAEFVTYLNGEIENGATMSEVQSAIANAVAEGDITQAQASILLSEYGR